MHVDGSCLNNGYDGARGGIGVYWGHNDPMNVSEPLHGRQTNNRAEIQAAARALDQARERGHDRVTVKTDSKFLKQGATEWRSKWESNNWRKADGGEVVNKSDWQDLREAERGLDVRYEYEPGHSGHRGNEAADSLAREGAYRNYRY